jgi:metal-responsive CopG/Arc/MetJ family transcriptional regulator
MKTIQMTLDEPLLEKVDAVVDKLRTSRSAFAREALQAALDQLVTLEQEERHRQGYLRTPAKPEELSDWEDEQVWPEGW